jgi:hypothetical protein
MNVPRHGSAEALKFRELIVLAAETALANDHYELAREQVKLSSCFDLVYIYPFADTVFALHVCPETSKRMTSSSNFHYLTFSFLSSRHGTFFCWTRHATSSARGPSSCKRTATQPWWTNRLGSEVSPCASGCAPAAPCLTRSKSRRLRPVPATNS